MNAARTLLGDPGLARVLALLNGDGEEARVVGGAVRNALMGRAHTDHDVTTTAVPGTVIARAKAAGLRTVPTGIAHGTVTLLVDGRPFEVTTLREDVETDGRHATIRFGRDFARDALRRDFTINALSLDREGQVHDYTGGLADLAAERVRFIGDAATRIREDYLRTLRFFRFSADYAAGDLDPAGLAAAVAERDGLARLSRERVRQELLKLVVARRAPEAVAAMSEAGLLGPLLAGVPRPARLRRLAEIAPGSGPMPCLAALAVAVREDAERLRERLKLSNAEAARLASAATALGRLHAAREAPQPRLLRELLFDQGRQASQDALLLAWAENGAGADDPAWCSARRFLTDTPEPRLPFSGADLVAHDVPAGRAMGVMLKRLQAAWIRAGFPEDPQVLSALLARAVSES